MGWHYLMLLFVVLPSASLDRGFTAPDLVRRVVEDGKMALNYITSGDEMTVFDKFLLDIDAAIARQGWKIIITKIDSSTAEGTQLASDLNVASKEHLMLIEGYEKIHHYKGGFTQEEVFSFVSKLITPQLKRLSSHDAFEQFKDSHEMSLIIHAGREQEMNVLPPITKALLMMSFGVPAAVVPADATDSPSSPWKSVFSRSPAYIYEKEDDSLTPVPAQLILDEGDSDALTNYLNIHARPLFEKFPANSAEVFKRGVDLIAFIFTDENGISPEVKEVARTLRSQMVFCVVINSDEEANGVRDYFEVLPAKKATIRVFDHVKERQFRPKTDGTSSDEMIEFLRGVVAGEIDLYRKSQPLPEDWDSKPLKVLVGSNFYEVTRDVTKTVFVMVYAPWCGHCKKIMPSFQRLAQHFETNPDIVIAKLDGTANTVDVEDKIRAFPTLLLFSRKTNAQIVYHGDRSFDGLKRFVENSGTHVSQPRNDEL